MKRDSILKGVGLFIMAWVIITIVSFVIFKPIERHTMPILISSIAIIVSIILFLYVKRVIDYVSLISFFGMFVVLGIFYLVPISDNIPVDAIELNAQVSSGFEDRYDYAQALFYEIEGRWYSPIRQYFLEPPKVFFIKSFSFFWNTESYVDSNVQAQMFRKMLLASGRFSKEEVRVVQHWCVSSPHGVVEIEHASGTIYGDLWAVDNFPREGVEEIYEFGMYARSPCNVLGGSSL